MKAEVENISTPAAWLAIASSLLTVLLLASLHLLSPEFDPSWRMVSEYALGDHEIVLSLMFGTWALSSWALAWAIRSQASTAMGTIGLSILILAGVGEALASLFNVLYGSRLRSFDDVLFVKRLRQRGTRQCL